MKPTCRSTRSKRIARWRKSFYEWMESTVALEYPTTFGTFRVSPRSFFQVNRFLIEALIEAALGTRDGETGAGSLRRRRPVRAAADREIREW